MLLSNYYSFILSRKPIWLEYIDRTRKEEANDAMVEQRTTLSIQQVLPRYLNYCQNISKNGSKELNQKLAEIKKFINWGFDHGFEIYNLSDVSSETAQQYFDFLVEVNGVAPKTFNNIRGRLKNFYNVARKRKWTSAENPFDMVDRQWNTYKK